MTHIYNGRRSIIAPNKERFNGASVSGGRAVPLCLKSVIFGQLGIGGLGQDVAVFEHNGGINAFAVVFLYDQLLGGTVFFDIDPEGVLQGYEVLTPLVGRNVDETIRQIQAFQLVRNSKGTSGDALMPLPCIGKHVQISVG